MLGVVPSRHVPLDLEDAMRSANGAIERALDEALSLTFPASDPVAISVPAASHAAEVADVHQRGSVSITQRRSRREWALPGHGFVRGEHR
jgi:hypothetical protein